MKKVAVVGIKIVVIFGILISLVSLSMANMREEHYRKIVVFEETFVNEAAQIALVRNFGAVIIKAYQAGITRVAAAGNNGGSGGAIVYPAKYPETIAVSAIGQDNRLAAFSSFGLEIDLATDGVWDPAEVQNKLKATAEDLGLNIGGQGAGLIRADLAIQ